MRRVQGRDVVWVWPEQFAVDGMPDGFALRIDRFLGAADPKRRGADRVWVCGPIFDQQVLGFGDQPITLVVSAYQPLASPDQPAHESEPDRLVVDGREYARRH